MNRYMVGFELEAENADKARDLFWEKIHFEEPSWEQTEVMITFVQGPFIKTRVTSGERTQEVQP